jgi:uncharacterized protein
MEITIFGPPIKDEVIELVGSSQDIDLQSDDYSFEEDIRVTCYVHRDGDIVVIKGEVIAPVEVNCSRCIELFKMEVKGTFSLVVKKMPVGIAVPQVIEEEDSINEEHLLYVEHDVARMDITEYVHDAVILALPLKPVCREDCKGLCYSCGHNLNESECGCERKNIDPRWQALSDILKKENK